MQLKMMTVSLTLLIAANSLSLAADAAGAAGRNDWPQWRGPDRNGVAPASPKLLDAIPTNGPKQVWKSDYIPFGWAGGWGSVVVSEGKLFLYVCWARQKDGGRYLKPFTPEFLQAVGWIPGVPDDLAKKLEDAWASKSRPGAAQCPTMKELIFDNPDLDAFLAKQPDLDKYIKDFTATLKPDEAAKYSAFIKRRLCMKKKGFQGGDAWDSLVKLSKLQGQEFKTSGQCWAAVENCGITPNGDGWIMGWACSFAGAPPTDTLVCLDAATGKQLWQKDFAVTPCRPGDGYGYPWSTTPAVSKGKVFLLCRSGTYCLSIKDGRVIWENKNGAATHASILIDGNFVYAPNGCAYEADTGRLLWKTKEWKGTSTDASPMVWQAGDKKYILCRGFCLDSATGALVWEKQLPANECTPVVLDGILLQNEYDHINAMKLTTAEKPPEAVWKKGWNTRENRVSPIAYRGCAYGIDAADSGGTWNCADLATGEIKWKGPAGVSADMTSPVIADGKLIVFGPPGHSHNEKGCGIYVFKASPEKFEEVGHWDAHAGSCQSPAIADGKLYFRTESEQGDYAVVCYDLRVR